MIEAGAIESITNMLQHENDSVQNVAAYALSGMAEHGAITHPHLVVET
jgi:hypothetical protein